MKKVLDQLSPMWEYNPREIAWPPKKNYYEHYALWASLIKPVTVLEIGVMYGWSIMAMLAGWNGIKDIVLIDSEMYGIPIADAKKQITLFCNREKIPVPRMHGIRMNTRQHTSLNVQGTFGLVHIDGEHSEEAVYNDIMLTVPLLSPFGTMIIDDISLPGIREGADRALVEHPYLTCKEVDTCQTHYLITR